MAGAVEAAGAVSTMLRDGTVMLGAALVGVVLFRKLGLGATLGYIVAGVVIGPQALALIGSPERIASVAELGIALLLFIVGLELHPSRLWRLRRKIFGLGVLQLLLCGAALTGLAYWGVGVSLAAAVAIGMPLALSSTAQVLPMLRADNELNTPDGERAFSILLLQDLALVPMIALIGALSRAPATSDASGWTTAAVTVGAIVAVVAAGRFLIAPLFRIVGRLGGRELFVVAGLFTVMAAAGFMHALGLSVALGAFIAGVMLAESPFRHEIESDVEPFRSLLIGIFFVAVGMMLDLNAIAARPGFVVALAVAVVIVKTVVLALIARGAGLRWGRALRLGLLLSQAGEFGFVLFALASDALLIAPEAKSLFGAVVTLSMLTTPLLMKLIDRLEAREAASGVALEGPEASPTTPAILIGHGRFGQTVGRMLTERGVDYTTIDIKPDQIELSGAYGHKVYYGDGTRIDLLRTAGADEARLLLFCCDPQALDRAALETVVKSFPNAEVLVRVYDRRQLVALDGLGINWMQRELYDSAIALGRRALAALGKPNDEIAAAERSYRRKDGDRLALQREKGDLAAGSGDAPIQSDPVLR